jgi:hypothetical protein
MRSVNTGNWPTGEAGRVAPLTRSERLFWHRCGMSTELDQMTDGQQNSLSMDPPAGPGPESPDQCQLQADAVSAAMHEANLAMRTLGERLKALRLCRESNGQPQSGFESTTQQQLQGLAEAVAICMRIG